MNRVILMGRLTKDPEIRYSQNDTSMAIARFSLAVDRRRSANNQDGQSADFISCVDFGSKCIFPCSIFRFLYINEAVYQYRNISVEYSR